MAVNEDNEDEKFVAEEADDDDSVYKEEERDELEEDDEISPTEEAFMEGYEEEDKVAKCATCGKPLLDIKTAVEREFKGHHYRFCSEKCAKSYKFGKK